MVGVDIARVRGLYPTLATGTAQLDGSFAALHPESVIRAVIATLRSSPSQPGSGSARSQRSALRVGRARRAAADLVGARADDIVLGGGEAALLWRFVGLLSSDWQLGDEIVLSRLDTDVMISAWLRAARERGVVVRWAEVDLETGELPTWQYDQLVGRRTRIVTVPLGNAATGMVPDVSAIAELAHKHGALVMADAGAAPCYLPLDIGEFGTDLLYVAAWAFGGPTVCALAARPGLLQELGELLDDEDATAPRAFEPGPLPIELLDGFTAAVDHLADLDEHARGPRRDRLIDSVSAAADYAGDLYARLDEGLRALPHVTVLGGPRRDLPVAGFTVEGCTPDELGAHLQRRDISVWTGPSGLDGLLRTFGADEYGGAAFLGVMAHTAPGEIDQFLDAMAELKH